MKTSYWLVLGILTACGLQAAACSSSFKSCEDTRTCVEIPDGSSTAGEGGAPPGGDTLNQAGSPSEGGSLEQGGSPDQGDVSGQGGAIGQAGTAGVSDAGPTLGETCAHNGALACNGSAQKLQLLCEGGTWQANGTCKADENCDETNGLCASILTECDGQTAGSLVCGTGDVLERCGPDLVSADEIETCTGKCVPQATSADCAPSTCGDGKVQAPEECDDGNTVNTDACTNACKNAKCGDGATWAGHEECDDANALNTDGCVAGCKLAKCGDTYVQAGKEQCEPSDPLTANSCSRTCSSTNWALWPMPNPASVAGLPRPASYDTSIAGVVTDKVTGLIWQREVDAGAYSLADAETYCANLTLASFSDWRLPTRIELVSLRDFTVASGAQIDASAFPNTPDKLFWSSSVYGSAIGVVGSGWVVGSGQVTASGAASLNRVRCVR